MLHPRLNELAEQCLQTHARRRKGFRDGLLHAVEHGKSNRRHYDRGNAGKDESPHRDPPKNRLTDEITI